MQAGRRTTAQWLLLGALVVLAMSFLVLLGSGLLLATRYRPTPPGVAVETARQSFQGVHRARSLHRFASQVALVASPAVFALALVVDAERRPSRRWLRSWVAVAVPLLALLAWRTGRLLPWDQVAIAVVTTGATYDGVLIAFRDDVRFFLIDLSEVSVATYRVWVVVHLVAVPALLAAAGVWLTRRTRPSVTELQ
jgi:quinol-cytochrome oxidoreductase complex cytochrome b subunit